MIELGYGLALQRERRGWRKVWNGYRDGVSLGWSYRDRMDAVRHMETLIEFERTIEELGLS